MSLGEVNSRDLHKTSHYNPSLEPNTSVLFVFLLENPLNLDRLLSFLEFVLRNRDPDLPIQKVLQFVLHGLDPL